MALSVTGVHCEIEPCGRTVAQVPLLTFHSIPRPPRAWKQPAVGGFRCTQANSCVYSPLPSCVLEPSVPHISELWRLRKVSLWQAGPPGQLLGQPELHSKVLSPNTKQNSQNKKCVLSDCSISVSKNTKCFLISSTV